MTTLIHKHYCTVHNVLYYIPPHPLFVTLIDKARLLTKASTEKYTRTDVAYGKKNTLAASHHTKTTSFACHPSDYWP